MLEKVCKLVMTFLEDIFSRHAVLHKCVTINKSGWKSRQSQTDDSISRNRTKIERLLDWKEFQSKSVGRFSFQCLTVIRTVLEIS